MNTPEQEQALKDKSQSQIENTTDPMEKLRLKLLARGSDSVGKVAKVFVAMDKDFSFSLNLNEFAKGMKEYGLPLTDEEAKSVYDRVDSDGSNKVSMSEFIEAVRPPLNPKRHEVVDLAFNKMDVTGDGEITISDMKGKVNLKYNIKVKSGEWTEQEALSHYLKSFESTSVKDGKVTKSEFLSYYSGVSRSIDDDEEFVDMIRSAYDL